MTSSNELCRHVENLLSCKAEYLKTEEVKEYFNNQLAWEGDVSVFKIDHAETDTFCLVIFC